MTRRPSLARALAAAVADSGPVVVLALIAAAGSFAHIRDTAAQHGQRGWMGWAIAVCIDLTCVMAARERQRDKCTGRRTRRVSWPTIVLAGGVTLSLAANLAQAQPTAWGWVSAATPAAAFLVAISMLERRAAATPSEGPDGFRVSEAAPSAFAPTASATPSPAGASEPAAVPDGARPQLPPAGRDVLPDQDDARPPSPEAGQSSAPGGPVRPAAPLVEFARRVAAEHESAHGRPITRDAMRARLGVSNQLASDLLRQIRAECGSDPAADPIAEAGPR